jgi:hypothetical protein
MLLEILIKTKEFDGDFFDRQEIEDIIDLELQSKSLGNVTGGGTGLNLMNIDLEITENIDKVFLISSIKKILNSLGLPKTTLIRFENTKTQIDE